MKWKFPYRPHRGQRNFHQDRLNKEWRALIAGTGSGKTYAGAAESIFWSLAYPGSKGAVFSPTYSMIKRNILPIYERFLGYPVEGNPLVKSFHRGDMVITWTNGSKTWFVSLEYPERAEGQSLDWAWVDEFRLVRYVTLSLRVIQRRLRGSGCGCPIGAWLTTTPDHPGSELHEFLEDPHKRNPNSRVYRMSLLHNRGNVPDSYIDNIIRSHKGALALRFIEGLFVAIEAGSLRFDYSKHVEGAPAWFKGDDIDLSNFRYIDYGVDYGWDNPSVILVVGFDDDGVAYVIEELYKPFLSIPDFVSEAREYIEKYGDGRFICDPTEKQTTMTLRHEGLRASLFKGDREDTIRMLGGRFQDRGNGTYGVYIHRRCVNTISELQIYDATKKVNDHAVDSLRYVTTKFVPRNRWDMVKVRR